jgi:hypothetical protein
MAQKLSGQSCRRRSRQRAAIESHLAAGIAHFRTQVLPMQRQQHIPLNAAQPEEKRHRGLLFQIIRQVRGGLEIGFLQHIFRVDSPLQALVQAKGDHTAQAVLMRFQERRPGLLVALRGPFKVRQSGA